MQKAANWWTLKDGRKNFHPFIFPFPFFPSCLCFSVWELHVFSLMLSRMIERVNEERERQESMILHFSFLLNIFLHTQWKYSFKPLTTFVRTMEYNPKVYTDFSLYCYVSHHVCCLQICSNTCSHFSFLSLSSNTKNCDIKIYLFNYINIFLLFIYQFLTIPFTPTTPLSPLSTSFSFVKCLNDKYKTWDENVVEKLKQEWRVRKKMWKANLCFH